MGVSAATCSMEVRMDTRDVLDLVYAALLLEVEKPMSPLMDIRQQGSVIILGAGDPEWEVTIRRVRA